MSPTDRHGATPCPVHPYGYHRRVRVNPAGRRPVFRERSPIGVPARCVYLEEALLEADREEEFRDELWMRERATRGHGLAMIGAILAAAIVSALVLLEADTIPTLVALVVGVLAVIALARADVSIQRERLRRIRDWHRRVGTPR